MAPKQDPWANARAVGSLIRSAGGNALGALNAYQQFMFGGQGQRPGIGRPAAAAPRDIQTAEPELPTEQGPGWMFQARSQMMQRNAPVAPQLPPPAATGRGATPIIRGTRDGVTPDRTQSDVYRQYAPAPMSPLAASYRAESEAGRKNMPEIVGGLTFGLEGQEAKAMEAWAKANPMLAQREFSKRFPAGEPTIGPTPATLQADESLKGVTRFFPGAEPGGFEPGVANAVPAPWNTQGAMVDAGRGAQNLQPFQMAKTTGEGMPDFEVTSAPVSERVRQFLGR